MKGGRVIAVFPTTHATLKAEKILKEDGLDIRTAVKPKGVSAGCQLALTMPGEAMDRAGALLEKQGEAAPRFYTAGDGGAWTPL